MNDKATMKATGHVFARDLDTNEVLVDTHNDVHLENLSNAIALSLARYDRGVIEEMQFGNGGSIVNSTGEISYQPPSVTGTVAGLYNMTYSKIVNDRSTQFADDATKNNIKVSHVSGADYTDIIVTCTLDYGEPSGQRLYDDSTVVNDTYTFDEVSLVAVDVNTEIRMPLTHAIFNPVQKSLNRAIEIIYTIRITMVS